jgi:hypothetical protein
MEVRQGNRAKQAIQSQMQTGRQICVLISAPDGFQQTVRCMQCRLRRMQGRGMSPWLPHRYFSFPCTSVLMRRTK